MQLELVLNEDEKKERFKASLAKKNRDQDLPSVHSTSQTTSSENSLTTGVEASHTEHTYSSPSERSSEFIMTNPSPSVFVSPFQTSHSPYHIRPTVKVEPMPNLSRRTSTTSTSLSTYSSGHVPNTHEQERIHEAPACSPFLNMPPLQPVQTPVNFCLLYKQSVNQHANFYPDTELNLPRNVLSHRFIDRKISTIEEAEASDVKAGIILVILYRGGSNNK